MANHSLLSLVALADNVRLNTYPEPLVPWTLPSGAPIGLLRPAVVAQLLRSDAFATTTTKSDSENENKDDSENKDESEDKDEDKDEDEDDDEYGTNVGAISFAPHLDTPAKRTAALHALCTRWRDSDARVFADVVGPAKWRDEPYGVYLDPFGPRSIDPPPNPNGDGEGNHAFTMERAACALFGVVTYGVHMTIYEQDQDADQDGGKGEDGVRIWVPRRAASKQTWPGYLDNTVAGGIPAGMSALDALVKEAREEADLDEALVRAHARAAGSVSYFNQTPAGWLQPEIQFVYDLRVPSPGDERFTPRPSDGEVASFELLALPAVRARMRAGEFKPNTALVLIDFLVRHGWVTPENEPEYLQIMTRMHGRFEWERWADPTPHRR